MLRPELVQRKLHLIADDLGHLTGFGGITREELVADPIRLAAVERILERIVLRAIDVNEHLIAALAPARRRGPPASPTARRSSAPPITASTTPTSPTASPAAPASATSWSTSTTTSTIPSSTRPSAPRWKTTAATSRRCGLS